MANAQNYITEDTTIKGNITTASSLTVAGAVEGDINAGGDVEVLDDALVKGDVSGPNIRILGKVEGRVTATGRLVISTSGSVVGDISVRALLIEEGGTLQGECNMGTAAAASTSTSTSNASPSASPITSKGTSTSVGSSSSGNSRPVPAPPIRAPDR